MTKEIMDGVTRPLRELANRARRDFNESARSYAEIQDKDSPFGVASLFVSETRREIYEVYSRRLDEWVRANA